MSRRIKLRPKTPLTTQLAILPTSTCCLRGVEGAVDDSLAGSNILEDVDGDADEC